MNDLANCRAADARLLARICLGLAVLAAIALCLLVTPARAQQAENPWAEARLHSPNIGAYRAVRGYRVHQPVDIRTNSQIVAEAVPFIGTRNPMGFRGPGCKAFVNMIARRAGYYANASMRAFDTAGMGQRIAYPVPGAYRVSARRGGGHVEIVAEVNGGTVTTISGNKGRNRVGWSYRSVAGARYYLPVGSRYASL